MIKKSHWMTSKKLCEAYGITGKKQWLICFGSVYPDLGIGNWLRLQGVDTCEGIVSKLQHPKHLGYFNLGRLLHYTADGYTYCHNIKVPVRQHSHYEKELHTWLKRQKFDRLLPHEYRFWKRYITIHKGYLDLCGSLPIDVAYICNELNELFSWYFNRLQQPVLSI